MNSDSPNTADIVEAATAFIEKLDECQPHIDGAFQFMWTHGMEYSGPQYGEALDRLRAALKDHRKAQAHDE